MAEKIHSRQPLGEIKIWSRRSTILPIFVGHKFLVHNGQKFISLLIKENMVGFKFGDFIFTRKPNLNAKIFAQRKKK
jgi:small subunit ribosomal protein S19